MFDSPNPFGAPASTFGSPHHVFGAPSTTVPAFGTVATSAIGAISAAQPQTGFGFGQLQTNTSVFQFSAPQTASGSAIVKYQPVSGTDAIKIDGQLVDLITKFHCITSMKKYEAKTIEELRFEDFLARRPGAGRVNNINTAATASSPPASNPFGGFGVSPFGDRRTNFFGQPVHQSTPKGTNGFNFFKKNVMSTMPDTASSHEAMMTTETLNENISWTKKFFTTVSNSVGSEFGVILLILLVTTSICLQILQLILCVYISGAKIQQDCSSNRKSAPTMDTLYSNIGTIVTVLLGIAIPTIKLSINRPHSS